MKINSRKFLILSYSLSGKPITYDHLAYLWLDISPGGRRGMIAHLLKQRLISVSYSGKQASFSLSSIGISWVEQEYFTKTLHDDHPGFVVFLYSDGAAKDPKVRKLKSLLKSQLNEISARVYFSGDSLTDELMGQLKRQYFSYVAVASLQEWLLGEKDLFQNYYLQKNDAIKSLSGISSEIDSLIDKNTCFNVSNHQSNLAIFSLLDRILSIIDLKTSDTQLKINNTLPAVELLGHFSKLF